MAILRQNKDMKRLSCIFMLLFLLSLTACGAEVSGAELAREEARRAADVYAPIMRADAGADLDAIYSRLAGAGYAVQDETGERDFANPGVITGFMQGVDAGGTDGVGFVRLCSDGGIIYTRLYHDGAAWHCATARITWENGAAREGFCTDYALTCLELTDKCSLIYTCDIPNNTAADKYDGRAAMGKHDGYIDPTTILRLSPADPALKALEEYIRRTGYNYNNLFTADWDGEDAHALCLNDIFLSLWYAEHGVYISYFNNPYPAYEGTMLSLVPGNEFEALIMKYLPLEAGDIRALAAYDEAAQAYPIAISGPHNGADTPTPEAVAYSANADGSVSITVDAVFLERATDRAFTHVVTVMPGEDGGFKYLSNRVIHTGNDIFPEYTSNFN